jgi:hypothetical protein
MLYREIIAVCSEIHTKHINTLCGQNVALLNVKPAGTYSDRWDLKVLSDKVKHLDNHTTFWYVTWDTCNIFSSREESLVLNVMSHGKLSNDDICTLPGGNYAASSCNPLPTFREMHFFLVFLALEDGTDTLSRNVGKGLSFDAA